MTLPRFRLLGAAMLLTLAACSSSTSKGSDSTDTSSTSTSSSLVGETTTSAGDTTTSAASATTAPQPTNAPATNPPTTNPPATNAPGPRVESATFNGPSACPAPDVSIALPPPTVSISWVVTGADSVYIAIDNPNGPFQSDLPLTGSIDGLPFGCPGTHTYYVVAVKGAQKDVEQRSFTAN